MHGCRLHYCSRLAFTFPDSDKQSQQSELDNTKGNQQGNSEQQQFRPCMDTFRHGDTSKRSALNSDAESCCRHTCCTRSSRMSTFSFLLSLRRVFSASMLRCSSPSINLIVPFCASIIPARSRSCCSRVSSRARMHSIASADCISTCHSRNLLIALKTTAHAHRQHTMVGFCCSHQRMRHQQRFPCAIGVKARACTLKYYTPGTCPY